MILLESYDRFDDFVELEPATGQMRVFSRTEHPGLAARPIQGAVSRLNDHILCLYRQGDILHFMIDDMDFELTSKTSIELVRGTKNTLTVLQDDAAIFRFEYTPYSADSVDEWRTYLNPFIEEEHFDFGIFVYNAIQDPDQRDAIFR